MIQFTLQPLRSMTKFRAFCTKIERRALNDRRFAGIAGAQWEDGYGEMFDNKPQLEINYTNLSLQRIFSDYRSNRVTVDFVSKDGSKSDELADACDGLYRADEQRSNAKEAYDNAFDEGTAGGFGGVAPDNQLRRRI